VSPVFRPASIAERIELIEEMIKTFVKNGAVRIVDPLGWSGDVKNRVGGISLCAWRRGLDGGGCPGNRVVRDFSARAKRQQEKSEQG
jgi:hypothetical protein